MIATHPPQRLLEDFVFGRLDLADNHRIVYHLLGGCSQCRQVTADVWGRIEDGLRANRAAPSDAEPAEPSVYDSVVDRAIDRAGQRAMSLDHERAEAIAKLEELSRHPLPRQITLVRNSRRFRSWALCEQLIQEGFRQRFDDPDQALERTQLAIEVAERVPEQEYGKALVRDLQGRAHSYLGNALRVSSDFQAAEQAFRTARNLLLEGTGDPLEKALLLRFEGHLAVALRRFELAPGLYDQAHEIYRQCGEKSAEAMVLLDKGYAYATADRPADAVTYLEEGLLRLDQDAEPRRALAARHNLIVCLNDSGRHEEALRRLDELRPSYRQLGDRLNLLRLRWLEGQVLERLERTFPAEEALLDAREGFMARGNAWESALVALDLAALFARTQRPREVRRIATEILPVFESRRVGRETVAALIAFHQAAQLEQVNVAMVRELASAIRGARA